MKSFFRSVLFLILVSLVIVPSLYAVGCPDCVRRAVVGKCENLALPDDFAEKEQAWFDCISEHMGYGHGTPWFLSEENMAD